MTRLRGHRTLNAEQPLYVRRAVLTINGATLAAGDVLPWQALGVTPRKLHQLWYARLIAHEKVGERNGAESPVELVSPIPSPAPTALPAVTVQPDTSTPPGFTAGGSIVVATTSDDRALIATDSQRAVFKVALGETVPVPPSQPTGRHKRR